ncbi:MAG: T9SS type A sorting domain-containing protein [Paludibacteraceae bacterium]
MNKNLLIALLLGCTSAAFGWDGAGSKQNPYLIQNESDLIDLRDQINRGDTEYEGYYFALTTDITLTGEWTPIGTEDFQFKGHLDGRNYGVRDINITATTDTVGFFARLNGAEIRNFRILNGQINGDSIVGGLVGLAQNATIINCANAANVEGKCIVGGIVGRAENTTIQTTFNIGQCSSNHATNKYANYVVGGLVGLATKTELNSCYNTGTISASDNHFYVGGLLGEGGEITIKNCYNIGKVTGSRASSILGTCSENQNTLSDCHSDQQLLPDLPLFGNPSEALLNCCTNVTLCDTKDLINKSGWGLFSDGNGSGCYPYFTDKSNVADDPLVHVSVAAAVLADGDNVNSINNDFAIATPDKWLCNNHKVHFDSNGTATVNLCEDGTDNATLTIASGDYARTFDIAIKNRCTVYTLDKTQPESVTLCETELDKDFGDRNHTKFQMTDFDINKNFVLDTVLTFNTIDGCDSVVKYTITCYPTPRAVRSTDLPANPIKIITGNSYTIKYNFENTFTGADYSTSIVDGGSSTNNVFTTTLRNIEADTLFYFKSLTSKFSNCSATPETLSDTIRIKVVDEVDITITIIGNGTVEDATKTLLANGQNEKAYLITPAAGWYLQKFECGLNEYARQNVTIVNGALQYAFTPTTDTELIATFAQVTPWDGTSTNEPLGNSDTLFIYTPDELAWVADQVNNQSNGFSGKTIILKNDIDLNGKTWEAIGTETMPFAGKFDTQCLTISNYTIDNTSPYRGLFGTVTGTINGLPLDAGAITSSSDNNIVCANYDAITISSQKPLSGGTNSTYLWQCNGQTVTDSTRSELIIAAGKSAGTYTYTRWATGNCDGDMLQAAGEYKITIREAFTAGQINEGTNEVHTNYEAIVIENKAAANGGGATTFLWKENGTVIPDATQATYTIPAGKAIGTYVYTRWAKNVDYCMNDYIQSEGTYTLTISNLTQVNITLNFDNENGNIDGNTIASTSQPNIYNINPNDGYYLASFESQALGDLLESVYVENGQLHFAFTPTQDDVLTAQFAAIPTWDGSTRKPFMTRNRDSVYIYIPQELAWIATQLQPATPVSPIAPRAMARAPYTRDDVDWTQTVVLLQEDLDCGGVRDIPNDSWAGTQWEPIGTEALPFTGKFDGQGHIIRNLFIKDAAKNNVGLFGVTGETTELKNFAIVSGNIEGSDYVGNVTGVNNGTIHHCYNMSEIRKAGKYSGGIAGYNNGTIHHVYNVGLITETAEYSGGIAGFNAATGVIDSVYCTSDVWLGKKPKGALVGQNEGTLTNAYWDNQMATGATGDGKNTDTSVLGKKTTEMFSIFADDNVNWIHGTNVYPQLTTLANTDAALVSVAPFFLYDAADKVENAHSVKHDFQVSTENGVAWASFRTEWIDIQNNNATLLYDDCFGTSVFIAAKLGDEYKKAQVNLALDGDFNPTEINTYTDYACSVADIKAIEGNAPTGGNSDSYVYKWICEDANGNQTEEAVDTTTMKYKPQVTEPGTYTYTRWTKDNACEKNYLQSGGKWTLVLLKEFDAGKIKNGKDTICLKQGVTPTAKLIENEQTATGGHADDITYRWTIATLNGIYSPITGSESAANSSYTPDISELKPGTYTIMRQVRDGENGCAGEWKTSAGCDTITLLAIFDAGAIKTIDNEKACIDNDMITLSAENDRTATGGDTHITYRWQLIFSDKNGNTLRTKTEENDDAALNYKFDKTTELPTADYPIYITIERYAKDNLCHTDWVKSDNSATYIIAPNESDELTISVCERDFPYTYEYAYRATAKGTKQITFDKPGDVRTIDDDETEWGCRLTITLTATATPTPEVAIVDSLLEICETESGNLFVKIEPLSGNPTKYRLHIDGNAFESVNEYTDIPSDNIIPITAIGTPQPRIYNAQLQFLGGTESCESTTINLQISISLDGYLHQKWNEVIVVNNSGELPGKPLVFNAYQWYHNGQKVENATLQHIYEPDGLNGTYYVLLTGEDGTRYRSCDFVPTLKTALPSSSIKVYPVPARVDETIIIELPSTSTTAGGTLQIYDAQGVQVYATDHVAAQMTFTGHLTQGVYLVRFVDNDGNENSTKFIVK